MRNVTWLHVAAAAFVVGCGGGDGEQTGVPPANDDAAIDGGTGDGGAGDGGTGDGGAGDGGADSALDASADADPDGGDGGPSTKGVTATATVAGGQSMKSTNYQLVMTVGQGPGGNAVMSSSTYKLRAGVVGATQP